jgi:hypothetical protein
MFCGEKAILEAYKLELDWHDTEVDNLNHRPYHEIGFQCRQIHISELVGHGSSSTTFSNSHSGEERSNS